MHNDAPIFGQLEKYLGDETLSESAKLYACRALLFKHLWTKKESGEWALNKKLKFKLVLAFHSDKIEHENNKRYKAIAEQYSRIESSESPEHENLKALMQLVNRVVYYTPEDCEALSGIYNKSQQNSEVNNRQQQPVQNSWVDALFMHINNHQIMLFTLMKAHAPFICKLFYPITYLFVAAESNFKTANNRFNEPLSALYQGITLGVGVTALLALAAITDSQYVSQLFMTESIGTGTHLVLLNLLSAEFAVLMSLFSMAMLDGIGGLGQDYKKAPFLSLGKRIAGNVFTLPAAILASIHPINFIKGCFQSPRAALAELSTWSLDNIRRGGQWLLSTMTLGTSLAALYFLPTLFVLKVAGTLGLTGILLNVPNILEKVRANPASLYEFPKQYIKDVASFYHAALQTGLDYTVKPVWQALSAMVSYGFDASYRAAKAIFNPLNHFMQSARQAATSSHQGGVSASNKVAASRSQQAQAVDDDSVQPVFNLFPGGRKPSAKKRKQPVASSRKRRVKQRQRAAGSSIKQRQKP